jgi:outer membrane lipoprotein LolB
LSGLRAAALLLAAVIGGCAALPAVEGDRTRAEARWQEHQAALGRIAGFELNGRLAGSAIGARADIAWQQSADGSYRIRVSGPFGAGALSLRGDDTQVEIHSRDGVTVTQDPAAWLYRQLGWTLPLTHLRWWALGMPAPSSPAQLRIDGAGHAVELRQDGWVLHYPEYHAAAATAGALPRRLEARIGELEFRLLADRWSPDHAP